MSEYPETTETTEEIENSPNPPESGTNVDNQQSLNSGGSANSGGSSNTDDDPETFPRDYVEKLRDENAKYRQRAQRADDLAERLHSTMVEATGRLADPTDLPFHDDHLEDSEALHGAIDELLQTKPHLAARRPAGDIGQGAAGSDAGNVDLAGLLRAGAN